MKLIKQLIEMIQVNEESKDDDLSPEERALIRAAERKLKAARVDISNWFPKNKKKPGSGTTTTSLVNGAKTNATKLRILLARKVDPNKIYIRFKGPVIKSNQPTPKIRAWRPHNYLFYGNEMIKFNEETGEVQVASRHSSNFKIFFKFNINDFTYRMKFDGKKYEFEFTLDTPLTFDDIYDYWVNPNYDQRGAFTNLEKMGTPQCKRYECNNPGSKECVCMTYNYQT